MMMKAKRTASTGGGVWIFLSWLCLALILAMMGILGGLICVNSFRALWPNGIERVELADGGVFLGFPVNSDVSPDGEARVQYKVGNRERNAGADFRWVYARDIAARDHPSDAVLVNRTENGDFLGFLKFSGDDDAGTGSAAKFHARLADYRSRWNAEAEPVRSMLAALGDEWQETHLAALKAEHRAAAASTPLERGKWQAMLDGSLEREKTIKAKSETAMERFNAIKAGFAGESVVFVAADSGRVEMPLSSVVAVTWPNAMGWTAKSKQFAVNVWNLLTQYPREANTEDGLFPALFGTIVLVFIMAVSAFPLGVATGVYLREYAKDGILSRTARVAVNNLAGVPSIVYGIFGLGFFIYGMGGPSTRCCIPNGWRRA